MASRARSGSAGMEAAFVNTVHPGDLVVVAVNRLFGQRMTDGVVAAHPSPAIVAAVHAETSTGVRSDIAALGAALRSQGSDAVLLVDAVSSIGGIELRVDDRGIDVGYAGRRSASASPGVKGGQRTYHHTAPTAMVASLHGGLTRIIDEGLEAVWSRHQQAGSALQAGLEDMGLELFAAEGSRLPELTTVKVPEGIDSAAVREELLDSHSIELGAGARAYASSVWRIGLMGRNARPDAVLLVLAALEDVLRRS